MSSNSNVQVGPGLFGICVIGSIVLAILKLTGVFAVSWLVGALPALVGFALTVVLVILGIALLAVAATAASRR